MQTGEVETTVYSLLEKFSSKTKACAFVSTTSMGTPVKPFSVQMVLARKEVPKYANEMHTMSELIEVYSNKATATNSV